MCKKIGIAAVAVVAGLLVLNHTKLGGWAKRSFSNLKERVVTSVVSPEDEIRSLKDKLNDFGPKVHDQINKMAEVKVEERKKEREIADQTAWLEKQAKTVMALRDDVKSETVKVKGGGQVDRKAERLQAELDKYKAAERSLEVKNKQLQLIKEKFEAAKTNLDNMQTMKLKLESQLALLEVRLEEARAAQSDSAVAFDDQALGEIKEDFAKLEERINKMEIKVDLEKQYLPTSIDGSNTKKSAVNVDTLLKEVDEQFGSKAGSKVAADRE
jgi:predicted  nucleic acid-binding Zn-ribbon protein